MSSNCPPQLHLELPPNTTSFKRSFEEFGFDLESPRSDATGPSGNDGNDRNKRARSAGSFSDDDESIGGSSSSTLASGSGSVSSGSGHESSVGSQAHSAAAHTTTLLGTPLLTLNLAYPSVEPPRLPTPDIEDIEMEYPLADSDDDSDDSIGQPSTSAMPTAFHADESYRLSLERFNAFDTQISALRQSHSPTSPRSRTPPPVLPPLELFGDEVPINTSTASFLHPPTQPSPPLPHSLYNFGLPGSRSTGRNETHPTNSRRPLHVASPIYDEDSPSQDYSDSQAHMWRRFSPGPWFDSWQDFESSNSLNAEQTNEEAAPTRPDSPIPTIGELRSLSPFSDGLEEMETTRRPVQTTPPTLPPIHGEMWDPLETLRPYTIDGMRSGSPNRTSQPSTLSRLSIPREPLPVRDRTQGTRPTSSGTMSSTSDSNPQTHTFPSPLSRELGGWLENEPAHPDWLGSSPHYSQQGQHQRNREDNSNFSFASNSTVQEPLAPSRLGTLHGIGEALQGLGRALMDNATTGDGSTFNRSNLASERTLSTRRSFPGANLDVLDDENDESNRGPLAVSGRPRLDPPGLPSPLGNHFPAWFAERRSRDVSPHLANDSPMPFDGLGHYSRRAVDNEARRTSPDTLRQDANANNPSLPSEQSRNNTLPSSWHTGSGRATAAASERLLATPQNERRPMPLSTRPWQLTGSFTDTFPMLRNLNAETNEVHTVVRPRGTSLSLLSPNQPTTLGTHISTGEASALNLAHPRYQDTSPNSTFPGGTPTTAAESSFAMQGSYLTNRNLLRHSRPSLAPSATYGHVHTHSLSSTQTQPRNSPPTFESTHDAHRRVARLSLMQFQRQASGRAPAAGPGSSSTSSHWPSPPRIPQDVQRRAHRSPPPSRMTYGQALREEQERQGQDRRSSLSRFVSDRSSSTFSSDDSSNLFDVAMDIDHGRSMRIGSTTTESSNRFLRSTTAVEPSLPTSTDERLRFRSSWNPSYPRSRATSRVPPEPDSFRDYLTIPILPTPDLGEALEYDSSIGSHERTVEQRPTHPSSFGLPLVHRSLSPDDHRRLGRSPSRRSSPPRPRRDLNPDSFASGPFRNTIQSLYQRVNRTNNSQTQMQPQHSYTPPSLPPLSFEEDSIPSPLHTYNSLHRSAESTSDSEVRDLLTRLGRSTAQAARSTRPDSSTPFGRHRGWYDDDDPPVDAPPPPRPLRRVLTRPTLPTSTTESISNRPDLYTLLTRRSRMEAPLLDDADRPLPTASRGDEDGLRRTLQVLRHDGLSSTRSQELNDRLYRDRQARVPGASTSPWGIMDQAGPLSRRPTESAPSDPPTPRIWRRQRATSMAFDQGGDESEPASLYGSHRERISARARRMRRQNPDMASLGIHEFFRGGLRRGGMQSGDYVRDEDWDSSYESLMTLTAALGEVKSRCTPANVIASLETGSYKDWKTADSDHRCPICLDDYQPDDSLLKLADCSHWLHRECLQQWLSGASTCPVCRETVTGSAGPSRSGASDTGPSRRRGSPGSGPRGGDGHGSDTANTRPPTAEWLVPWR